MTRTCFRLVLAFLAVLSIAQGQNLYVSSINTSSVLQYNGASGAFINAFVPANSGGLVAPQGLIFGPDSNLYVSSVGTNSVLKYNGSTGAFIGVFVAANSGGLMGPIGLAFGPDGNLYVVSNANNSVLKYNGGTGAFIGPFVPAGGGGLTSPFGLIFGTDGNLYVASSQTHSVLKYNGSTGAFIGAFVPANSGGLMDPVGLTFGPDTNLYVSSFLNNSVLKYNGSTGAFINAFVPANSGGLNGPDGLTFGPDGNLYVSSSQSSGVLKYDGGTGNFISVFVPAGSGGLNGPTFLVFFPSQAKIMKAFGAATVPLGGTTSLTFTVSNTGASALNDTSFTDTLPAGLVVATPSGLMGNCAPGTITATAGSGTVSLATAAFAAGASCTFSVNVTATTPGVKTNSVTVSDVIAGVGTTVTAVLGVVAPPILTKAFGASIIDINAITTLGFTLTNPNATVALTGVAFNDTLPAGLTVATPNGLPNGTCGGTITAVGNTIMVSGVTLAASGSCTFSVNVTGISPGVWTNTTSTVTSVNGGTGLAATATITVLPVISAQGEFQIRYLANLDKGDSFVNLTNAGTLDGRAPAGNICVNVYTFDPAEELISCCACPITPNGLVSLSARNDLISNTLTPGVPTSITVKLVSSAVFGTGAAAGVNISAATCNAAAVGSGVIGPPNTGNILTRGMRAWATTLHLNTSGSPAVGYQKTETPFSAAELSLSELAKLQSFCGFIQANGSGFGICKSCRFGALGAEKK